MLEKTFQPDQVEPKQYTRWEAVAAFAADENSNQAPYVIMMPPPNVTGSLHMGHALTFTLQDVLIRYQRMRGKDALWQPGTDHAGIATQMVVERQLAAEGVSRHDLGREGFLKRVWQWKEESGGTITKQLRRLGASPDWRRQRFTLDEGLSLAVRKVFVDLYREGLIYRDKRLVNWDPKLHTAISDLEVLQKETKGNLWHLSYPIEGQSGRFITVATTRPETMFGDTGIAVHPEDERYRDLIGKFAILPLMGRRLRIVSDDYADPEKGSGAVKITPAHDFNDFSVGKRHGLEMVNIFDQDAKLNENVPESYRGLDRFKAREKVLSELESLGAIAKIEATVHMVPHGDRSGVILEPWMTDQWFVDAKVLAKPAIEAVEQGKTKFVPQQWENTFFEWMRNIQPWCISRQLWWGHQIPAWYGPDGKIFVAMEESEALNEARIHYGEDTPLTRDADVLDTWFSSALWPFSTLGWPEPTKTLDKYYPGDVLVTGFDIIFFWVARMMMMGLKFMGEVPFREVYIHALVRDTAGQKMSKSKGNVIDPLAIAEKYGTDALRFTLVALAAQGRDIRMSEERVEGYRNFATKLWNASRFCQMNECLLDRNFDPAGVKEPINRWMVGRLVLAKGAIDKAMGEYRFNEAAQSLYKTVWGEFCDWYLEFAKPIFQGEDLSAKKETRATTAWILGQLLHLLHPFMPFLTEELWEATGGKGLLIKAIWPDYPTEWVDKKADADLDWLIRLVSEIRSLRTEMNVSPGIEITLQWRDANPQTQLRLKEMAPLIQRLARVKDMAALTRDDPKEAAQIILEETIFFLPLAEIIDLDKERLRLRKELAKAMEDIEKIEKKLANPQFVAKADPEVIEEQHQRLKDASLAKSKLGQALERLA